MQVQAQNEEAATYIAELQKKTTFAPDPDSLRCNASRRLSAVLRARADSHLGEKYKAGNQCDDWVAKVQNEGNVESSKYFTGSTTQKTVKQHIDQLLTTGGSYSDPKKGANVVFMGEGTIDRTVGHEHAGLLFVNDDNSVGFYHSSRDNTGELSMKEHYDSVEAFKSDFAYNDFYFQPVE